jgi:hypothetical protein
MSQVISQAPERAGRLPSEYVENGAILRWEGPECKSEGRNPKSETMTAISNPAMIQRGLDREGGHVMAEPA